MQYLSLIMSLVGDLIYDDTMDEQPAGPTGGKATGPDDLRRRRAEVTRQAIREAVEGLLVDEHPAALSIPAVAARAGVSVRTVYRYFPTKQDLLDDVAEIQQRRADEIMDGRQDLFDRPGRYLATLWTDFERDVEAIRAQHLSPVGRDIRLRRLEALRSQMQVRLDKAFPQASTKDRADLGDLITLIMSSSAFLELHTRMGHTGPDAARLAWWAARAMQKQFKADSGLS